MMFLRRVAVLAIAWCLPPYVYASDPDRGRELHDRHCTQCHDASLYQRPDRLVRDLAALRERVRNCELSAELLWFDEDVDDVTDYLNRDFYRFEERPAK